MAWWPQRYAPGDAILAQLEAQAKAAKRGPWRDPRAMTPWRFETGANDLARGLGAMSGRRDARVEASRLGHHRLAAEKVRQAVTLRYIAAYDPAQGFTRDVSVVKTGVCESAPRCARRRNLFCKIFSMLLITLEAQAPDGMNGSRHAPFAGSSSTALPSSSMHLGGGVDS